MGTLLKQYRRACEEEEPVGSYAKPGAPAGYVTSDPCGDSDSQVRAERKIVSSQVLWTTRNARHDRRDRYHWLRRLAGSAGDFSSVRSWWKPRLRCAHLLFVRSLFIHRSAGYLRAGQHSGAGGGIQRCEPCQLAVGGAAARAVTCIDVSFID